jgi:hypothetical protein
MTASSLKGFGLGLRPSGRSSLPERLSVNCRHLTDINVEAPIGCNRVSGFHELTPRQPKVIQTI